MRFEPVPGKLLIRPLKEVKVTKKISVPDEEKNKDKKPTDIQEVKKISKRLPSNFQLGEVTAATNLYEVGDIVVFRPNPVAYISFDLIKGVYLIDGYLVVGKWKGENSEILGNNPDHFMNIK